MDLSACWLGMDWGLRDSLELLPSVSGHIGWEVALAWEWHWILIQVHLIVSGIFTRLMMAAVHKMRWHLSNGLINSSLRRGWILSWMLAHLWHKLAFREHIRRHLTKYWTTLYKV